MELTRAGRGVGAPGRLQIQSRMTERGTTK